MDEQRGISPESRRIARNTVLLYGRMFLLLLIGLFTSRVVLRELGVEDYGVYNAVGGLVTLFTLVSASVTQAIVRYISYSLGQGDAEKLRRVFSTSVIIQCIFALVVVLLVESLGLWFLHSRMNIPEGRMDAAGWVLQCSAGVLVLNLLSIPYNACITAHEDMSAYAWISLLDGTLKLLVALGLYFSPSDKLKTYAMLMLAVALVVRLCYAAYCRRHFEETRGRISFDRSMVREMSGFAGWNFLGSGAYLVNTQGVNLLSNVFFGVGVNAARGVALQVEGIVKQMVSSLLTAINPQITKSWAAGNSLYSFSLVMKGSKFSFLVIWLFALPLFFEAPAVLEIWLVDPPQEAALFVRLTMLGLLADMLCNPLLTLALANGKIRLWYLVTSAIALLAFPLVWLAFRLGMPASGAYIVFALIYLCVDVAKVLLLKRLCGFPAGEFLRLCLRMALCTALSVLPVAALCHLIPDGLLRLFIVLVAGSLATAACAWLFLLTDGEKSFIKSKLKCH